MKLSKLSKLATVSAFALLLASSANAAQYNNGDDVPMTATATVTNSFQATVTAVDFGTINVIRSATDAATFVMDPDGTPHDDQTGTPGDATITAVSGQTAGTVILTELPPSTQINIDYHNVGTIDGTVAAAGSSFALDVQDNLGDVALTAGAGIQAGSTDTGDTNAVQGQATSDTSGGLSFEVGGALTTNTTDLYKAGVYTGNFDMTVSF